MVNFTNYLRYAVRRQSLKQLFIATLLLLATTSSFAYDFMVDDICYNKLSVNTVKVTSNPKEYSGDIVIPATINYNDTTYSVTSIGNYAFHGCSSLTSIDMPDGITSIGEYSFMNCSGLTYIKFPKELTSIGMCAFYGCSGLTSIDIPDGITSIGQSTFGSCSGLTTIDIPEGIISIGTQAFIECSGLTSVTISDGVTSIGMNAFMDCSSLTSITIGKSVTSIGDWALFRCSSLKSIICKCDTPPTCGTDALYEISTRICTLYVPEESISLYKSTSPWGRFFNIVAIQSTDIDDIKDNGEVKIESNAGNINISGTIGGETIEVYNVGGSKLKSVKVGGSETTISGLQSGNVYIVKIGGSKVKVAM